MIELRRCVSYFVVQVVARRQDTCCDTRKAGAKEYMKVNLPLVAVVDDDESVRESLPDLLKELGFAARTFSSAEAFLGSDSVNQTKCLILDIVMPGMSGPDLQQELKLRHQEIPIVFFTGRRDDTDRALLLEKGAVACLLKPFSETALLGAIQLALKSPE
jgi:FixJ family two-component response regulator